MPAKNSIKHFLENAFYHLYNRGVEKRKIFLDEQDHTVFLSYIKQYLAPEGSDRKSLANEVELLAFCLMPNHFHLLVRQFTKDGITKLMRAISTNYVMYFNKKYNRVGTLFQGKYKGVLIDTDSYLLHLSRYIHLNSIELGSDPKTYPYSSYGYYLGKKSASWLNQEEIISFFKTAHKTSLKDHLSYESFVDGYALNPEEILGGLVLEN